MDTPGKFQGAKSSTISECKGISHSGQVHRKVGCRESPLPEKNLPQPCMLHSIQPLESLTRLGTLRAKGPTSRKPKPTQDSKCYESSSKAQHIMGVKITISSGVHC